MHAKNTDTVILISGTYKQLIILRRNPGHSSTYVQYLQHAALCIVPCTPLDFLRKLDFNPAFYLQYLKDHAPIGFLSLSNSTDITSHHLYQESTVLTSHLCTVPLSKSEASRARLPTWDPTTSDFLRYLSLCNSTDITSHKI